MKSIHLELVLTLEWERIDTVRQAVELCLQAAFDNAELESSIAMVSTELLENAAKYGKSSAQVRLLVEELPDGVRVVVRNPVENASPHSDVLKQRLAWLGNFTDAQSAYIAALERAYENPGEGGLGLARIAHEGGCNIQCETSVSGEVTVSAWRQRPLTERVSA